MSRTNVRRRPSARAALPVTLLALAALATGTACTETEFEEDFEIVKLRTLAIRAEPPAIGPGENAELSVLTVHPEGPEGISWRWEVCAITEGPDSFYACADGPDGTSTVLAEGSGPSVTFVNPLDSATLREICAQLSSIELPEFAEIPNCQTGIDVTVRVVATRGDEEEVAVRGLTLLFDEFAGRSDRNENPIIAGLLVNGEVADPSSPPTVPLAEGPEGAIRLSALVGADQVQRFRPVVDGEEKEERSERLRMTWYTTRGRPEREVTYYDVVKAPLDDFQSNLLEFTGKRSATPGETIRVWAVVRDDRGGVDFLERPIRVVPPVPASP